MKKNYLLLPGLALMAIVLSFGCGNNESRAATQSFASTAAATEPIQPETPVEQSSTVYVCKSSGAKKYHFDADCQGLGRCKHTIVKMSEEDAQNRGLGVCGYESN